MKKILPKDLENIIYDYVYAMKKHEINEELKDFMDLKLNECFVCRKGKCITKNDCEYCGINFCIDCNDIFIKNYTCCFCIGSLNHFRNCLKNISLCFIIIYCVFILFQIVNEINKYL